METIEDFAEIVGEDNESEEYRYIIPNLKWKKFEDIKKEYYRKNKPDEYDEEKRGKLLRVYDQLVETGSYASTSTSDSTEETSGEEKHVSSPPQSEGEGVAGPSKNTTKAANVPEIELTDEEKEFASKMILFATNLKPFQELFSEMCTTPRYEYLKKWYRKISTRIVDDLEKAEAKMLAEKTEIESSEKDFKSEDETHWEDEYYAYLSNSENDEGRVEYFDKYQKSTRGDEEGEGGKEHDTPINTHCKSNRPTHKPVLGSCSYAAERTNRHQHGGSYNKNNPPKTPVKPVPECGDNNTTGWTGKRKGGSNRTKS
ncbi:hypothetical protein JTB14_008114 [Gonioctena quinquepunctata]|nr:hypothetical protein JTB14_008114 [Gonioctena quinquepunctata]